MKGEMRRKRRGRGNPACSFARGYCVTTIHGWLKNCRKHL
jgi:hypothetical protein